MSKNDGGPAFPTQVAREGKPTIHELEKILEGPVGQVEVTPSGEVRVVHPGMSLRDWYRSQCPLTIEHALSTWSFDTFERLSYNDRIEFWKWYRTLADEYADAMLKERENSHE